MCNLCDAPNLTADDGLVHLRAVIARNRFAVLGVEGSRSVAEFSYTIGLTEHGLPELIITGLRQEPAARLLELWGSYLLDESVVLPGETLETGPWLLEAVEVDRPQEHLLVARRLYGDDIRAMQLAWADEGGRWPWERGHRARRAGQPVLGTPAPWFCKEHSPSGLDVLPPHL